MTPAATQNPDPAALALLRQELLRKIIASERRRQARLAGADRHSNALCRLSRPGERFERRLEAETVGRGDG